MLSKLLAENLIAKLWNQMTMATSSKILEEGSYKSMITIESSVIRGRKNTITAAKNKNIITHSKLQKFGICIF